MKKFLIAGFGNIFKGDDGFGVQVIQQLLQLKSLDFKDCEIIDFGIRSREFSYHLLDHTYENILIVDLIESSSKKPGELIILEPDLNNTSEYTWDHHFTGPQALLWAAQELKKESRAIGKVYYLGCSPEFIPDDHLLDDQISQNVQLAIPLAVRMISELIKENNHA